MVTTAILHPPHTHTMNFSTSYLQPPNNAVPCLADITLGSDGPRHSALLDMGVDSSNRDRADIGLHVRQVFWRAQVGVTKVGGTQNVADGQDKLVIVALNTPPNQLMDRRPTDVAPAETPEQETSTLAGKIAHLFHHDSKASPQPSPITSFPGVIEGKPLAAITVPLTSLDGKHYVMDNQSSKTSILIPVASTDPEGQATLRFEFDNWLSSKADVEILHDQIQLALRNINHPAVAAVAAPAAAPVDPPMTAERAKAMWAGRDQDGSTHPSGDAQYDADWKKEW
jgi:hypothetical protein